VPSGATSKDGLLPIAGRNAIAIQIGHAKNGRSTGRGQWFDGTGASSPFTTLLATEVTAEYWAAANSHGQHPSRVQKLPADLRPRLGPQRRDCGIAGMSPHRSYCDKRRCVRRASGIRVFCTQSAAGLRRGAIPLKSPGATCDRGPEQRRPGAASRPTGMQELSQVPAERQPCQQTHDQRSSSQHETLQLREAYPRGIRQISV